MQYPNVKEEILSEKTKQMKNAKHVYGLNEQELNREN